MRRLPGYRRGSFVLHIFAIAILFISGLFGAGDGIDERIAHASTPIRPDVPSLSDATVASRNASTLAKLDSIVPGSRTYLEPNYPNPVYVVNGQTSTKIWFSVARTMVVSIRVYDYFYRQVEVLVDNEQFNAGRYNVDFNITPGLNNGIVFSGMYFYEMRAEREVFTRRMMVIK